MTKTKNIKEKKMNKNKMKTENKIEDVEIEIFDEMMKIINGWWSFDMDDKNYLWMKELPCDDITFDDVVDDRKKLIELNDKWMKIYSGMSFLPHYDSYHKDLLHNNPLTIEGSEEENPYGDEVYYTILKTKYVFNRKEMGL